MGKLGGSEVLRKAVSGMLPKNRLRSERLARLKCFEGRGEGGVMGNVVKYGGFRVEEVREREKRGEEWEEGVMKLAEKVQELQVKETTV